ncbi:predicted protein [Sclerotinia sclerotiorum 1980 UF-70]|uniref:Uncharacterized protein n=1 Tax=Sclerotinia sclerotiorum (strain ATCC 18683 / 1980 / Ss-1) TaxID=665079 RepID=A7E4V2_SCLS1|nr:predicted protein [Sclerotinia sclerotiorum 1980 UF-70]EDN90924.1 predicted protein [Sclerotinia sclerotiorum 1980 UF-70]
MESRNQGTKDAKWLNGVEMVNRSAMTRVTLSYNNYNN